MFFLMLFVYRTDMVMPATSAQGNAHHTILTPPIFAKMYAHGMMMRSRRTRDKFMLYTLLPRAWKAAPLIMAYPANGKFSEMM